jgi:ribosomal protein L37E
MNRVTDSIDIPSIHEDPLKRGRHRFYNTNGREEHVLREGLRMNGKRRKGTARKCRNCGEFNELNARYCGHCGHPLSGHESVRGQKRAGSKGREPSYWIIAAVIALIFSVGLGVKMAFYPSQEIQQGERTYQVPVVADDSVERKVQLVASNFKCACGGCGELPLIECECDMPRGAQEEKDFIRKKLREGLTVNHVIQLVEKKYGLRISG